MTIDEAVEILKTLEARTQNYSTMFKKDALKLGIEALTAIKEGRQKPGGMFFHDLPGETES